MTHDAELPSLHAIDSAVIEDSDLLRRYADSGSEDAFAELVRRRIGLVYSVALRQTHGDRHRAEDATQAVFTDLARKARSLAQRPVLAGWLHRSAQFAAAALVRAEQRRHAREQEAHTMEKILGPDEPEPEWEKVRPVLDEALSKIAEPDRDAILLRFFDGRSFADIGRRLRLTENTARMRVERALDKLNAALARRGVTSTTAAVAVALGQQASVATPLGLASTVTGAALTETVAAGGSWFVTFMSMSKLQAGIAGAVAAAGATGIALQAQNIGSIRDELAMFHGTQQAVAKLRLENQQLASAAAEVETLRRDDLELKQLSEKITAAQKAKSESDRRARAREQNAQAELDRLNREGNALVEHYKLLAARAKDPSLTPEERDQADAAAKQKLEEIRAKQREVQALIKATGISSQGSLQLRSAEGPRRAAVTGESQAWPTR